MSELSQAERTAWMDYLGVSPKSEEVPDPSTDFQAAWRRGRDYGRARERTLDKALVRADELLMAANGALGRALSQAHGSECPSSLIGALEDVRARLAAVSDTTFTALASPGEPEEGPSDLTRALNAFCKAFGQGITWREVLPILERAGGVGTGGESDEEDLCNAEDSGCHVGVLQRRFAQPDHGPGEPVVSPEEATGLEDGWA